MSNSIEARTRHENIAIAGRIQKIFDASPPLHTAADGTVRISVFERTPRAGGETIYLERADEACLAEDHEFIAGKLWELETGMFTEQKKRL